MKIVILSFLICLFIATQAGKHEPKKKDKEKTKKASPKEKAVPDGDFTVILGGAGKKGPKLLFKEGKPMLQDANGNILHLSYAKSKDNEKMKFRSSAGKETKGKRRKKHFRGLFPLKGDLDQRKLKENNTSPEVYPTYERSRRNYKIPKGDLDQRKLKENNTSPEGLRIKHRVIIKKVYPTNERSRRNYKIPKAKRLIKKVRRNRKNKQSAKHLRRSARRKTSKTTKMRYAKTVHS